jgi:MFS family permease
MRTAPAVALVTAAALLGDTLLYSALPVNAARLGLDALAVGLALSLNRWVRLLTNPFAARLYQRIPAGALILVALALGVVSTALYALPVVLVAFLGARLVWGLSWSLLRLGTLLSAIEGATGRAGRALGEARAVYGLGYLGGAIYAPFAVESFGWGAAALGAAALTLLLGIGPALTVAGWRREVEVNEHEEAAVRRSIVDPRFLGIFAVAAVQYAVYAGIIAVGGGLRIAELFPDGAPVLAVPMAATVIAGLFVLTQRISQVAWTPFAGRFADRSLTVTFAASTALAVVAMLALAAARDATAFVALGALAFFAGITSVVALELAIAHRTPPADRPRIFGAYNTWADAGAAAGALGAGLLALPGTHVPFLAAGSLAAATLLSVPTVAIRTASVGASVP